MTPTDKLSEIDNPLERIEELTAERDRFGDRIDDLAAEVIRLRAINTQLVADFNTMNQHGAKQDETIRELRLQLGMANHAEDATRAENTGMVKVSTELAAEAKRLMAQLAAADRLADEANGYGIYTLSEHVAAFRAIRGGGNG